MVFTINGLCNTTVSVDDDMLYYEIITHFWQLHLTKISKLDVDKSQMVLVAEIERVPGSNLLSECVLAVRRFGYRMGQLTGCHELGIGGAVSVHCCLGFFLLPSADQQTGVHRRPRHRGPVDN